LGHGVDISTQLTAARDGWLISLCDVGRFGGGAYTKCMTCVDVPFVLPCLEATCLATGAKSKRDKHQYV